ncbi:L,D-transpeptidase family protein [Sphingomonas sp.]|uniref:L,D-transpeptidase family protein n=1 Tax=Sphingomonas sp. TaxID=28214 RepID=UPI0038A14AF6
MPRLLLGLGSFILGGTTAATLSVGNHAQAPVAVARPVQQTALSPGRMTLAAASVRQALAEEQILRSVSTVLKVPQRMTYGEFRWDDRGVPAGPIWVRIDLKSQILSVFRGGHEIGTAVILYGADGLATPTGKFPVLAKLKDHRSQTYDAPMPYTLRLTADGVSIHGSNVRWGYATHGCVGVPTAFASKLFAAVSVGDDVLIVGGGPAKAARA